VGQDTPECRADAYLEAISLGEAAQRLEGAGQLVGIAPGGAGGRSAAADGRAAAVDGAVGADGLLSPCLWAAEQARSDCSTSPAANVAATVPKHLSFDSRDCVAGTLFYCKGAGFEECYLAAAAAAGAIAYLSEQAYGSPLPGLIVKDMRKSMALLDSWYFAGLAQALRLAGVTGTKGKSTTVYFLRAILDRWLAGQGRPASAVLSSIDNYDGLSLEESHLTTQENLELYRRFANAASAGIGYLSMEVSSQALKYERTADLVFDVACFLNIGHGDHISEIEHPDFEDYLASKLKIFKQAKVACLSLESAELKRVLAAAKEAGRLVTFGFSEAADIVATEVEDGASGCRFRALLPDGAPGSAATGASGSAATGAEFTIALSGTFNVLNALAAISAAWVLGVPVPVMQEALAEARVPGRMETFAGPAGKLVVVDYAHNKMSFEALFEAFKKQRPNSYFAIVFGCPGYKAYDRRRDLAEVAGHQADDVILTEEDAGREPVAKICAEIAGYVQAAGGHPRIISDRAEAIRAAIETAPPNSVILVTGKGRETRQKRGSEYIEVPSDVQIVEGCLGARCGGTC